jgi:hypothetical protein
MQVNTQLRAIYEEIMWLANRPNVTASAARAWYTHIAVERIKKHIRQFSGLISLKAASNAEAVLRLEHYKRIQTTLTQLVERHLNEGCYDADEFVKVIHDCEQVHIVTVDENYAAMKAKGDYALAGIELVSWNVQPFQVQTILWNKMLKGKVSNAVDFVPRHQENL